MSISGGYGSGKTENGKSAVNSVNGKTGDVQLNKNDIDLNEVDNTSDLDKPISINQQEKITQTLQDAIEYANDLKQDTDNFLDFIKESDIIEKPFVAFVNLNEIDLSTDISVSPNVISGTQPFKYEIIDGSLPAGLSIDENSGAVSGFVNNIDFGSVTIRTSNPKGFYDFVLNWNVKMKAGVNEFLNSEEKYPFFISTESDFENVYFVKLEGYQGAINSSYIYNNLYNAQVYYHPYDVPNNGFNYAYIMFHETSTYWYMFKSNFAPEELQNGLDLVNNLSSNSYELSGSDNHDFSVENMFYPADTQISYLCHPNYISLGNDESLNGFLSSDKQWCFGFTAVEDIPQDFLGRSLFERENGNFLGFKSLNDSYEYFLYGKNQNCFYDSLDGNLGVISAGDKIQICFDGTNIYLKKNGQVINYTYNSSYYMETSTISDLKNVNFGKCSLSNVSYNNYQNQYKFLTYFQGLIKDLWISNGYYLSDSECLEISMNENIEDSINYSKITHHWKLSEQTGSTFIESKNNLNGYGSKND